MTVHVYVYENTATTLWFESLVVCEGGPWVLIREYDKEIPDPPGPGGTTDYNQLSNLPSINNVQVKGSKSSEQYNIINMTQAEKTKLTGLADIKQIGDGLELDPSTGTLSNTGGQGGTVDQTYDATSTNAQSGTAVAQAVAPKANQSSVTALYNTTEQLKTDINSVNADLQDFKSDYQMDMGGILQTLGEKPDISVLNDSASIATTTDGTPQRLAIGLEDNTDKIRVNIRNGASEKQMHAETEQSMKRPADAGLAPVLEIPNNAQLMTTQDPQAQTFAYVMMGDNTAWVGELTTNTSPYVYKRLGTDTTMVTLEVAKDGDEWGLRAYDGTMDQKNWRFFTSSPVIPRVQSWLEGVATTEEVNAGDAALQAQINEIPVGNNFEVGAEKWYGTYRVDGVTYQVYSKLLDIGPLPSTAGVTNYPHGITGIKQILQINGFTNDGFVMNAPRQNVQDNISIYQAQKSGNIAVEVGKDRSSKTGFVMLIYAKNN